MTKASQQQSAGLIVADDSNRQNIDAQVRKIVDCVGAATGNNCAFAMSKNEDGSLARNAGYFAEYEFVGDHIAEHGHSHAWEALHDLGQAIGFSWGLAHVLTNSLTRRAYGRQSCAK